MGFDQLIRDSQSGQGADTATNAEEERRERRQRRYCGNLIVAFTNRAFQSAIRSTSPNPRRIKYIRRGPIRTQDRNRNCPPVHTLRLRRGAVKIAQDRRLEYAINIGTIATVVTAQRFIGPLLFEDDRSKRLR